ncbi:acyl-CoA dehydrogenase family protein [Sansalvadorimonas sp. 2012CJ34-2]|uniref:Acyl-CoA dehydrogenase family protein n=1 Tax=Parendozoicomonas callyspongiae TaxID=2942213 RepID=A0ABT0PJT5_9GAMM|nr:acyl-CoA dehydrogenase family protein [Sansalvadorimonas sp. 2012CJ34-2]MCL6271619.1 acyl-CoA dehydrogenase family protein [Sansalvadorimonas sp. 2012CJ34-2]
MSQDIPSVHRTHTVFNQVPSLDNWNLFTSDIALHEQLHLHNGSWGEEQAHHYGKIAGNLFEAGFLANENLPQLKTHDRYGNRVDVATFHPSYHQLMRSAIEHGLHSLPWTNPQPGAHVVRAAQMYMQNQVEAGHCCPLTMTFAAVPAINMQPDVAKIWLPRIYAKVYDPDNKPWFEKEGLTIGMAMTEKQGGTDVRANTTSATAIGARGPGQLYELLGHKWFCSAPMCDAFLTLAQSDGGLSCFLVPRWRSDGSKNAIEIQRLKDKQGNKANASSEIEYRNAEAWMIGEEGRGVPTIITMVAMTRFDCMAGSAGLMRQALAQASHHCRYREVFGKPLNQHPLMQNVLADLALESEAAIAMTMRVARALDNIEDEQEQLFARIAVAIGKYWICKRAPAHINEAQECLGGVGYVEETILPRLYREAPVNSIWEGSGNVQCLDVLRALNKQPATLEALMAEFQRNRGMEPLLDRKLNQLGSRMKTLVRNPTELEYQARSMIEDLAICMQANQLLDGDSTVASAFCASRLRDNTNLVYGTLPAGIPVQKLVQRAAPVL